MQNSIQPSVSRISVAPMIGCTDRHDRYFLRLLAPDVLLYTEMITAQALQHRGPDHLLAYDEIEHPVALQLGGSDTGLLAVCAKLGESWGYDEINLNVGCPSARVSAGRFGACLMLEPELVADCVKAMQDQVSVPVTVKCRLGVDDQDSYAALSHFVHLLAEAGCKKIIIHARKAWLKGLSPKQNREVPPLQYEKVYQIKKDFPTLTIILNGGIQSITDVEKHLAEVDGIMIGRKAYANPYFLAQIQSHYLSSKQIPTREEVIKKYLTYVYKQIKNGVMLSAMTRHVLGLYHGQCGAASWRRHLSENANKPGAGVEVIEQALICIR